MIIEVLQVGPFQSNCVILADHKTRQATVIDPGDDAPDILAFLKDEKLTVSHLLLTHGHIDHIAACGELAREMNAKICLHQDDEQLFDGLKDQARQFGVAVRGEHNTVDHYLKDGEALITQEGLTLKVLHTPGHSPGSVCFYADDFTLTSPKGIIEHIPLLCCGDTLFLGSIGRTDLWGGDHRALISGVKNKIFTLPDDTLVIPGHGPTTSVGQEKATNSFFQ